MAARTLTEARAHREKLMRRLREVNSRVDVLEEQVVTAQAIMDMACDHYGYNPAFLTKTGLRPQHHKAKVVIIGLAKELSGVSNIDLAHQMGVDPGTVKRAVQRARTVIAEDRDFREDWSAISDMVKE